MGEGFGDGGLTTSIGVPEFHFNFPATFVHLYFTPSNTTDTFTLGHIFPGTGLAARAEFIEKKDKTRINLITFEILATQLG
jgi:hypothetical protein